jgi:hypothetical protein
VLVASRVQVAGDIDELLATHRQATGKDDSLEDLVLAYMARGVGEGRS